MKPMEMAEALFGNDDEQLADAMAAVDAAGIADDGSINARAMKALADFMQKQEAGEIPPRRPVPARSQAAKPAGGGPIDLAAAREEGLRTATAPQHYVDSVKRQKIAEAEAKMGPTLVQPVKGAKKTARKTSGAASSAASPKGASKKAATKKATKKTAAAVAASTASVASQAGRTSAETADLTLLGNQGTRYPQDYDPSVLETFVNKHPDNDYFVKFNCPEFTSLCPITGQPDFATIYISYVPGERMVESKSLKLYLFSFRNHGDFHEDCMNIIMKDLIALMDPKYIEIWGKFTPRGGISIDPYVNYGRPGTPWEKVAWDRLTHHDMYPEKVDNR